MIRVELGRQQSVLVREITQGLREIRQCSVELIMEKTLTKVSQEYYQNMPNP